MFAGYKDEYAVPTEKTVGTFIKPKDMEKWWKQMQKKFPSIYPPEENCPVQHVSGTKMMCYVDDDPNKPVRVEIVGSRFRTDKLMGKQAMYIIRNNNTQKLEETEFSSAHEDDPEIGWCLGWDVPPPDPNAAKDDDDEGDNANNNNYTYRQSDDDDDDDSENDNDNPPPPPKKKQKKK